MPDTPNQDGAIVRTVRLTQRHLAPVAVCGLVGLLLGLAFGLTRPTVYQAETKLVVGTFDAPADAVPGYVLAAQTVAGDYARLAGTPRVLDPLSEQLGMSAQDIGNKVSIVSIPGSAIVRVTATSGDEEEARRMAETTSSVIQETVTALNLPPDDSDLLAQYTAVATELAQANSRLGNAEVNNLADVPAATAARDTLNVRADDLKARYLASQEGVSSSGQVRALGGAVIYEKSKTVTTLAATLVGLVVGLGAGLLLALGRDRAGRHRLAVVETHPAAEIHHVEDADEPHDPDAPDGVAS